MSPLFIPGPVDVAPQVLAAQARPMIPLDSDEFHELYNRAIGKLKSLFGIEHRLFLMSGSRSQLQEMCIRSLVQEQVLCCVNGGDSSSWAAVAEANRKQVDRLETAFGEAVRPELLSEKLKEKHYEAVLFTHVDTTTGVENPIQDLCSVIKESSPDTLICVDAAASLGGTEIKVEEWGIDFVLAVSEMSLGLPPGLGIIIVSDLSLKQANSVSERGCCSDILRYEKRRLANLPPDALPVSLIYALDTQLDRIVMEGLDARFARNAEMAALVVNWAEENGVAVLAEKPYCSDILTVLDNTRGMDIEALNRYLLESGMRIANGAGGMQNKYFRIAHMAETQPGDVRSLLTAVDVFLTR